MSEEGRLEYVKRLVGFPSAISLAEGKIWVLWDPLLNITFSTLAEQLVDMEISSPGGSFFFSAVYARCTGVARRPLWSAMERLASSRQGSWMVAGDFNIITEASERLGGAAPNTRHMEDFNQTLFHCGLTTVEFEGPKYTWTNGRVWHRLDRVVINQEWAEMCSVTRVLHLSRGRSDHAPLLIKCGSGRQGKSAFRYLNVWPRHSSFLGIVQEVWGGGGPSRTMSEFFQKLLGVKSKLKVWNKEVFRNIETRVAELERDMRAAEMQYDTGRTVEAKIVYHEARAAYMKQLAVECGFWRQKSRIKWIQERDANTAFFHSVVRQRRASNYISGIRSATRQWLTEVEDIKSSAAAFFQALFSSDRDTDRQPCLPFTLPQVSQGDNESILALPTTDEVREVVFSISPDSAPGPDGFGSGFYQSGFVPGRQIVDNILLAQEHANELDRRLEVPNLLLKLDMEKAYDRVEWSFLLFMLRSFGFQEPAVDLIFRLVANNWFSVLVNGEPAGFFKSTRGVRQGDPISLGLFVLVAEFFGKGLYSLFRHDRHRFFQAGGIKIPYLAFADDVIIFTRLARETLEAINDFFKRYQQYSGQKINVAKSGFVCSSRVSETQVELVASILGFQRQFFPMVYLGVPISRGRCSSIAFDGILARVRARIFHWSGKLLSMGGKLILIKHVLNSMPLHLLQVLKPPKTVLVALGRLFNSFLWDKSREDKRTHWASWEKLCFPTEEGGLGVRSLEDMVKAFSHKLWWRLRQRGSLWSDFMYSKYIGDQHPLQVAVTRPTGTWKRLLGIREVAEAQISWSLGPGMVDFWLDTWCELGPLTALVPEESDRPHFLVAEFLDRDGWNRGRLLHWLPANLVDLIVDIPFDLEGQDHILWATSASGQFTLTSAWELCRQRRTILPLAQWVWNKGTPLKISLFAWRLLNNFLPLDSVMRRRGLPVVSRCSCCLQEAESVPHLFVNGPIASEVWGHFASKFGILHSTPDDIQLVWRMWATSLTRIPAHHIRCVLPFVITWFIWRGRNKARFEGQVFSARGVIVEVGNFLHDLGRANRLDKVQFRGDQD
ncbi:uncharacterized protein LOC113759985 [Coffea eugenioides]|uniref:uncharacterized protein LOC113759983 n=1 Tax=Coffea eugenioides TaxID=49369 RepID=UPI000F60CDE7|nr:uncharacterized protein LOC113759983 [Coffea eugenioides]XP_027158366.1 uncharacterized protein LOC113759985 [Coffea eugenioides]